MDGAVLRLKKFEESGDNTGYLQGFIEAISRFATIGARERGAFAVADRMNDETRAFLSFCVRDTEVSQNG